MFQDIICLFADPALDDSFGHYSIIVGHMGIVQARSTAFSTHEKWSHPRGVTEDRVLMRIKDSCIQLNVHPSLYQVFHTNIWHIFQLLQITDISQYFSRLSRLARFCGRCFANLNYSAFRNKVPLAATLFLRLYSVSTPMGKGCRERHRSRMPCPIDTLFSPNSCGQYIKSF